MIQDYLKAGYPALCVLTQEPDRAEQSLPCEGVQFYAWDCIRGIHPAKKPNHIQVEIRDPVEAVRWLDGRQDTVLIATICICSLIFRKWYRQFKTESPHGKQLAPVW